MAADERNDRTTDDSPALDERPVEAGPGEPSLDVLLPHEATEAVTPHPPEDELASAGVVNRTPWQILWLKLRKNRTAMTALVVLVLLYAVAMLGKRSGWIHNIRAAPDVRLKLGRRTYDARAREVESSEERRAVAEAYVPSAGWFDYVDYANLMWSFPTARKVLRGHQDWLERGTPVVFELTR